MMAGAPHPNVAAALATIARTEGAGALFNGVLLSAVVKQAPQMAITFATYEVRTQVCTCAGAAGLRPRAGMHALSLHVCMRVQLACSWQLATGSWQLAAAEACSKGHMYVSLSRLQMAKRFLALH